MKKNLKLLIDRKGRRFLINVVPGGKSHFHHGTIIHDEILAGKTHIVSSKGAKFVVMEPSLEDYVLKMPRRAQIVYPKESSRIVSLLDLKDGDRVLEAGSGSGSLTLFLGRAVAPSGLVVSYDVRPEHQMQAMKNVEGWKEHIPVEWRIGKVEEVPENSFYDAVVLDLPTPWVVVSHIKKALKPSGRIVLYLPNIPQITKAVSSLKENNFFNITTMEILVREWEIDGDHGIAHPEMRMVSHTAFLVYGIYLPDI